MLPMSALPSSHKVVLVPRAAPTAQGRRRFGIARLSICPPPHAPPPSGLEHLKRIYD